MLRRFGLRQRMITFLGIFLFVQVAVVATWEANRERELITHQMQNDGLALAKSYALSAENALLLHGAGLARVTGEAGRSAGIRYMAIINENYQVIAHTDPNLLGTSRRDEMITRALQTPIDAVDAGRTPIISQEIVQKGDELYRVLVPLVILDQAKGVMEIGLETELIRNLAFTTSLEVALIALVAYLLGIIFVVGFVRSITQPVLDLSRASTRIAQGDLEQPILIAGQDEIGQLAESLEKMRSELRESFRHMRERAAEIERLKIFSENILNSINAGVITLDMDARISGINQAALHLLGLDRESLIGQPHDGVFAPWPELAALVGELLVGRTVSRELVLDIEEPGLGRRQCLIRVTGSELRNQDGRVIGDVLALDDVSLLRSMEQRVHDSEKMAVMGELTAGVAHEVRNPLASIRNAAQFLDGKLPPHEACARFPRLIMGEVDRLNHLVTRLLQFNRQELGASELLDIRESIDNSVALAELKIAASRIRIECDFEPGLPLIHGDSRHLVQVFVNILFNAIDDISGQGSIMLTGRKAERFGQPGILVTVKDSGGGVSEEDLGRIFDPFFTTREGGTGLGLSIVRQIVQEHGGSVSAASHAGEGTLIFLFFPIAHEEFGYVEKRAD